MSHRILIHRIECEMTVLGIALYPPLALQITGNALSYSTGELGDLVMGRGLDPAKPHWGSGIVHIDAIKEQHMKMNIQI